MSWKLAAVAILGLAYIYQAGFFGLDILSFPSSLLAKYTQPITMSPKQKVLYLTKPQGSFEVAEADIPEPGPGEVLVEIHATALNPVDWKIAAYNFFVTEYPAVLGTDSAGVVKKVGEGVTNVAVGDKVYAWCLVCVRLSPNVIPPSVHQGYFDNRRATFQQYTVTEAEIVAKVRLALRFKRIWY